jgi:hypothetical protein
VTHYVFYERNRCPEDLGSRAEFANVAGHS